MCVVGWLPVDVRVCLLLLCLFSRCVCSGVVVCCRCWIVLLMLGLFVVVQLLMLVELCVVVGICGVTLWLVVVRCVVFVARYRCVLLVVVAVC